MADDKWKVTLHLKVSHREARDLWQQLSKHFSQKQQQDDEVPDNVCPECGRFKRGDRVGPDKVLCYTCQLKLSPYLMRQEARERREARRVSSQINAVRSRRVRV